MFYLENSLLGSRLVLAFLKEEVAPQVALGWFYMSFFTEHDLQNLDQARLVLAFLKKEEAAPQVLHQCLSSKWGSSVQPLEPNIEQSFIDYYSQWWEGANSYKWSQ